MISLILTLLYLAKDTVHRWLTRISSPLARVLVVFFLTLCALFFLGSYVITAKVIRDRIRAEGGDLIHAFISPDRERSFCMPTQPELEQNLQADSLALRNIGAARIPNGPHLQLYSYDFQRIGQILPLMAEGGTPTILCPAQGEHSLPEAPTDVIIFGEKTLRTVAVRHMPPGHLMERLLPHGGLLVQPDIAQELMGDSFGNCAHQLLIRVRELRTAADIERIEQYLKTLIRLEGAHGSVNSASALLEQMDVILSNQMQCRAAFCLGIVAIVGILLTALAGMEYRQNEYIYTLMKSFGIHPLLLVFNFIMENLLLVGVSFGAALAVFMHSQKIILTQFFKLGAYRLDLMEIMPEIRLISAALLLCVLVSALPIFVAANREIGRVLK